jgi:hypothetical protein
MSNHPGVHVVNPEKFDPGTAQTPGSERVAAITPQLGIEMAMWGGSIRSGAERSHRNSSSRRAAAFDGARPDNERRLRSLGSLESWTRNGTDEISYAVCASVGAARAPSSPPTRFTKTEISTALMSRSPTSSRPRWTPFLRRGFEIKEYGTLGCRPQSERETSKRFA